MRRAARLLPFAFGSVAYWIAAAGLAAILGFAVPGDCGTERTAAGQHRCLADVRIVVLGSLGIAAVAYGFACYRLVRRK
jgi:hypothetical protein